MFYAYDASFDVIGNLRIFLVLRWTKQDLNHTSSTGTIHGSRAARHVCSSSFTSGRRACEPQGPSIHVTVGGPTYGPQTLCWGSMFVLYSGCFGYVIGHVEIASGWYDIYAGCHRQLQNLSEKSNHYIYQQHVLGKGQAPSSGPCVMMKTSVCPFFLKKFFSSPFKALFSSEK